MAIFFFHITSVGRAAGRTATAAAAYRAGERLRDERTGTLYNYENRRDVLFKEITLPSRIPATEATWARDRATLWNSAERAEPRRNSRVAREYMLAIPSELSAQQRVGLTRALARDLSDRYNAAVDAAIHAPRARGDQRNYHAHFLTTTREVTATGLGAKTGLDMHNDTRRRLGLGNQYTEFLALREHTATRVNEALAAAQLSVRVAQRSLGTEATERESRPRLPWGAYLAEKRGLHSDIADRVRDRYRARIQARAQLAQKSEVPAQPLSLNELQRQARENWLQLRAAAQAQAQSQSQSQTQAPTQASVSQSLSAGQTAERKPSSLKTPDYDLAL